MLEAGSGYYWRCTNLQDALPQGDSTSYVQQASPLGDLSSLKKIAEDKLGYVNTGNSSASN